MHDFKHSVCVFNCHYNGLSIIQELGRRGVTVFAFDSKRSVGTYSRFAKFKACPDPMYDEEGFIQFLLDHCAKQEHKPMLFPTNDQWAYAISKHQDRLQSVAILCVTDFKSMQLIIEKQQFYDWGEQHGYPVPKSWVATAYAELPDSAFPIVAKPEYRRISGVEADFNQSDLDANRLTVLENRTELKAFVNRHSGLLPYMLLQEYVRGFSDSMFTIGVYADQHYRVREVFTGRKVRGMPPEYGNCMVGQQESVPEEIISMVKEICANIEYSGIAEFEFKQDSVSGKFKLIEINPRSWSWVGITPFTPHNLIWVAFCDLAGIEVSSPSEQQDKTDQNVIFVRLFDDFLNTIFVNKPYGPPWHLSIHDWMKSLRADKLVIAEHARFDPLPLIFALYKFLRKWVGYMLNRTPTP